MTAQVNEEVVPAFFWRFGAHRDAATGEVRFFTGGAVIGGRDFVNGALASARERFGPKRNDGARALKGSGKGPRGGLWSVWDLRKEIV
jgi:hypothetical protein